MINTYRGQVLSLRNTSKQQIEWITMLQKTKPNWLAEFKPEKSRERISALQAALRHAEAMEEWQAGQRAAEWMVSEIRQFVAWWDAAVGIGNANRKRVTELKPVSADNAEKETGISKVQVHRWRRELARPGYEARGITASHKRFLNKERLSEGRAALQTGEMEWFTPAEYVERARRVLGSIDLDPASCAAAQRTIRAARYYTIKHDGLTKQWRGRVWLNPPYAGGVVAAFANKMAEAWNSGELPAAIMLTNAYTETSWFHALAAESSAVCFTRGRIKFESPHGEKCSPTNGQAFFYFGSDTDKFYAEFEPVGLVMGHFF
jgi:phage N-6-adenine-methyltransferase